MTATVAPVTFQVPFYVDNVGEPLASGSIQTFVAGTSTPLATYTDFTGTTQNATTIPLNNDGTPETNGIFLDVTKSYKFVWFDSAGTQVRSQDNITSTVGILYPQTAGEIAAGVTPTNTSFPPGYVQRFGGVADGVTDIGPAIQAAVNSTENGSNTVIVLPPGTCFLNSAVVINNKSVTIQGQYYTEGPNAAMGTWLSITSPSFTPFLIENSNARGTVFQNFAVKQSQPNITNPWTPTAYPYVFSIQNTLGQVTFDNILLAGVTNGITCFNSGRLYIRSLYGQVYTNAVNIDLCEDIPRVEYMHIWTYVTSDPNIINYTSANLDVLLLGRCDGIFIDDLFAIACRAVIHMTKTASGITTKAYVSNLYCDLSQFGVWIDSTSNNSTIQIANATTQHNNFNEGATPLVNGSGLQIDANDCIVQIGNWRTNLVYNSAFNIPGANNLVYVQSFVVNGYNSQNNGSGAITAVASNNFVNVGYYNLQAGNNGPLATNTGTVGAIAVMNVEANAVNFPFMQASPTGHGVVFYAVGPDTNIDVNITPQGAGVVVMNGPANITVAGGVTGLVVGSKATSGTETAISFVENSTVVGSITTTATATAYNTSSDYRLKENVVPLQNALDKLTLLQPKTFNFIQDPKTTIDGFIAHEVQQVVPTAVTGKKDGDIYQQIDHSKLVPLLTASLLELNLKVKLMESQLNLQH